LDDLLGSLPVQHRELEGFESPAFSECFSSIPGGLRYLDGGIDSGFRHVTADEGAVSQLPVRMYHVVKSSKDKTPRSALVPATCQSLNSGDAFVLDAGSTVYTWYGPECSAFEKHKAIEMASSMVDSRNGQAIMEEDVGEDNEAFWELLGGKTNIATSSPAMSHDFSNASPLLYVLQDEDSRLKVFQVECSSENLDTSAVCMIDLGSECILWIGKAATKREQSQAMSMMGTYLKDLGRHHNTPVSRVCEGQESRCSSWSKVF
jgi:gelsolin